jgi:hypothetical protein
MSTSLASGKPPLFSNKDLKLPQSKKNCKKKILERWNGGMVEGGSQRTEDRRQMTVGQ